MTGRLAGRRIVITGAGSGIGRASANLFAAEGAQLALLDLDEKAVKATSEETGGEAFAVDITNAEQVKAVLAQAATAMSGIDGLLNSAGIAALEPFGSIDPDRWRRILEVNLTGTFIMCQSALVHLRQSPNAAIVNLASGQALLPSLTGSAYAASKAGVMMFTKAIALELGGSVRANAVCPGTTLTPMTDGLVSPDDTVTRERMASLYAMKRLVDPKEVAASILFLMSDEASAITGIAMAVDGGRTFH
ncbi:SDR family NAD(P)-dependent oxidoreductase [Rhizobium leguminosarum]|uniref:SDR family NAD(P)-dependent oxidoreductase n=1 Tax=Rhizobium leguminosarum TaxID=384 RepID=UPI0024A7C832|nr:SDR family NAD(P)-dependent oxidoreductase [Rhizobium leguminosarum]MDI5930009.1 SDR family NAD(P)-dependent oxidoreductase [Rhizobium leguminosarum]